MDEKNILRAIREFRWFTVLGALSLIAMGLFLILWPDNALTYICYLVGAMAAVYGVVSITCYVIARDKSLAFQLVLGILAIVAGAFLIFFPKLIFEFVQIAVCVLVVIDSLFILRRAYIMQRMKMKDWWVTLLLALAEIALGVLFIMKRDLFGKFLFYVMGGVLVFQGATDLLNALRLTVKGRRERKKLGTPKDEHAE